MSAEPDAAVARADRLTWLEVELAELERHDLMRHRRVRAAEMGAEIELDGERLVNFGSNDYLGLAADERLAAALQAAVASAGCGAGASPLLAGYHDRHVALEAALAAFEGTEAALVFGSGYAANLGTVAALVGRGDTVFSDELNHASLIDGCRLSRADVVVYRHGDVDHLADLLAESHGAGRRLIVTDGLFSMDGDVAPLAAFCELAERNNAMLLVDEAHATGVFGPRGRGAAEACGVAERVDIRVGTLSKALGGVGGFVAGRKTLIEWLVNRARPYVFSTALPPAVAAASLAALEMVAQQPWRRERLAAISARLRQSLVEQGWNIGDSTSQIVPLLVGSAERALELSHRLQQAGLYVPAIRPPSVAVGQSRLRISLTAKHDDRHVDRLLAALDAQR